MPERKTLTVGELKEMLDGVNDDCEVYLQKSYTPLGAEGYIAAHGAEMTVGIKDGYGINFPAEEDINEGIYEDSEQGNYFLMFP